MGGHLESASSLLSISGCAQIYLFSASRPWQRCDPSSIFGLEHLEEVHNCTKGWATSRSPCTERECQAAASRQESHHLASPCKPPMRNGPSHKDLLVHISYHSPHSGHRKWKRCPNPPPHGRKSLKVHILQVWPQEKLAHPRTWPQVHNLLSGQIISKVHNPSSNRRCPRAPVLGPHPARRRVTGAHFPSRCTSRCPADALILGAHSRFLADAHLHLDFPFCRCPPNGRANGSQCTRPQGKVLQPIAPSLCAHRLLFYRDESISLHLSPCAHRNPLPNINLAETRDLHMCTASFGNPESRCTIIIWAE